MTTTINIPNIVSELAYAASTHEDISGLLIQAARYIRDLQNRVIVLQDESTSNGWLLNPDRMGGGGYTEEEKRPVWK